MPIDSEDWKELKKDIKDNFNNLFDRLNDIDKRFTSHSEITLERLKLGNERFEKIEAEIKIQRIDLLEHIKNNIQAEMSVLFIEKNMQIIEKVIEDYREKNENKKLIKKEFLSNIIKVLLSVGTIGFIVRFVIDIFQKKGTP